MLSCRFISAPNLLNVEDNTCVFAQRIRVGLDDNRELFLITKFKFVLLTVS